MQAKRKTAARQQAKTFRIRIWGGWPISHVLTAGLAMAMAVASTAQSADLVRISPEKKVIEWGYDAPTPAYMRANAKRMDGYGFDGVIFHTDRFNWSFWGATRFEYSEFAQVIEDIKAANAQFKNMTHNFLRVNATPGNVDWFDDEAFAVVLHNAMLAARVSKEGGGVGLMFDVETYKGQVWRYPEQLHKDTKSFSEYEEKVRERGQELMRAFQQYYPDITLLMTYGYEITGIGADDRSKFTYALLKNLLDGMYDAITGKATIVDGFEGGYGFRVHSEFVNARKHVFERLISGVGNPKKYLKYGRLGFGIWMDNPAGIDPAGQEGWDTDDLAKNYFIPEEFEYSVFSGLDVADRYVWVYTQQPWWWTNKRLPKEYQEALRRAKTPRLIDDARYLGRKVKDALGTGGFAAATQAGYSDEETFGDLHDKFDFVADLPKAWKFRTDSEGKGIKYGWHKADLDLEGWRDIVIGKFWDEQGVRYHGEDAWYRLTWDTPAVPVPAGSRLYLYFGAVDETATVWVNGVEAGGHYEQPDIGWTQRFPIDVTGKLKPGQVNTIAVQVGNELFAGGIWKSVKLAVEKKTD